MREFLSLIIMPVSVLFLLILAGIFFLWRKKKKTGKLLFLVAGCWLLIASTRPIPAMLVRNLENQYSQLSDSIISELPNSVNIIVLGGGHSDDKDLSPNNQLSTVALARLVEAVRIYRRVIGKQYSVFGKKAEEDNDNQPITDNRLLNTNIKLVVSGYSGRSKLPQAEVLYQTALMLGMDSADIVLSPLPSNTTAEAKEYIKKFGTEKLLVVVTSAIHMPRAILLFKEARVTVIPAPTNFILKYGSVKGPWRWLPSAGNIQMMEQAVHEYAGILWAKLGGK
jgi:uncharacterized SAM-binding protein YcdF (DUF218 family)